MTVKEIIADYLKQNGYDGLHNHAENQKYAGCGCSIKKMLVCQECTGTCEPAYRHTKADCKKCPDRVKCEPFESGEKFMYCGKKIL